MLKKVLFMLSCFSIAVISFAEPVSDIMTGKYGETILGKGFPVATALSPDNKTLATGTYLGIFLWDLNQDSSHPYKFIPVEEFLYKDNMALKAFFNYPYCLQFIDNEKLVAGVDTLFIYNIKDGTKTSSIPLDQIGIRLRAYNFSTPVISPDAKWIFTCQPSLLFKKWDISTGKVYSQYQSPSFDIGNTFTNKVIYITQDGKYMLYLREDQQNTILMSNVEEWNNQSPSSRPPSVISFPDNYYVYSIQCCDNPDEICITTCIPEGNLYKYAYHRYSFNANKILFECDLPDSDQPSLTYQPLNGVSFIFNNLIMNVSDGTPVRKLENTDTIDPIAPLYCHKNGYLISGYDKNSFYVWDSLTGKCILKSTNPIHFPLDSVFAYSPASNQLNINDKMYDVAKNELKELPMDGDYTLQFSLDGKRIFRTNIYYHSDVDNVIYICDSMTGTTSQTLKVTGKPEFISPDEKTAWARQNSNGVTDQTQFKIYDLSAGTMTNEITLQLNTTSFSQAKISPWGDEILFIGDKGFAVPFPSLSPIMEIPIHGDSVEYGDTPEEIYYSIFSSIKQYGRKTGKEESLLDFMGFYRELYKIKNKPYMIAKWQVSVSASPAVFDLKKKSLINSFPLSEDKFLVIDHDKKAATNCLDGTIRIWDLAEFIPEYAGITDYQKYEQAN